MKPIIKWSGGKRKEIDKFKAFFPKQFNLYVEPFVGGGAVLFDLEFGNNVIADVHKDLINFYQQIKIGNAEVILKLVERFKKTEEDYYKVRDEFIPVNDVERAGQFLYLRRTCFRGMLRYNSSGGFNVPFGKYKSVSFKDIVNEKYFEILSNTEICNCSFEKIFEVYDDENTFIFLDPPYDSRFTNYGFCSFGKEEHRKLNECFKITKSKCLLVIGKTDFIEELYKNYIVESYEKKYAFRIHSKRIGSEIDNQHLIISNYL